ncbi:MAG TPA: fibrobacter succinogenes major paralogous domain-containing protein, partial [Panacibacter sp.]|nr:fibrobacter succinogenes major paralogous domain-containing protein [Panacibacter sp.]
SSKQFLSANDNSSTEALLSNIDGSASDTISIGTQAWRSINLNLDHYRNGDKIPQVTDPAAWVSLTTGAWCYYNNDPATGAVYGKLYNWYAVVDGRGLAPKGWHIPSDKEWTKLTTFLGGEAVAGGKMKETGTTHWYYPNGDATNSSGFTALPSGYRSTDTFAGTFDLIGNRGFWWSTSSLMSYSWSRSLNYGNGIIYRTYNIRQYGYSVRCIKD